MTRSVNCSVACQIQFSRLKSFSQPKAPDIPEEPENLIYAHLLKIDIGSCIPRKCREHERLYSIVMRQHLYRAVPREYEQASVEC